MYVTFYGALLSFVLFLSNSMFAAKLSDAAEVKEFSIKKGHRIKLLSVNNSFSSVRYWFSSFSVIDSLDADVCYIWCIVCQILAVINDFPVAFVCSCLTISQHTPKTFMVSFSFYHPSIKYVKSTWSSVLYF